MLAARMPNSAMPRSTSMNWMRSVRLTGPTLRATGCTRVLREGPDYMATLRESTMAASCSPRVVLFLHDHLALHFAVMHSANFRTLEFVGPRFFGDEVQYLVDVLFDFAVVFGMIEFQSDDRLVFAAFGLKGQLSSVCFLDGMDRQAHMFAGLDVDFTRGEFIFLGGNVNSLQGAIRILRTARHDGHNTSDKNRAQADPYSQFAPRALLER